MKEDAPVYGLVRFTGEGYSSGDAGKLMLVANEDKRTVAQLQAYWKDIDRELVAVCHYAPISSGAHFYEIVTKTVTKHVPITTYEYVDEEVVTVGGRYTPPAG